MWPTSIQTHTYSDKGYWRRTRWSHQQYTCSSTSWQRGSSTAALWSHSPDAKDQVKIIETVWASNQHKSPLQVYVLWMINMKYLPCLSLWAGGDRDVLRRQEENDTQGPCVHLGNGNSEDQDPGEEAGQGVDDHQKGVSQQQPHVGGETMLHNKKYPTIDLPCSRN